MKLRIIKEMEIKNCSLVILIISLLVGVIGCKTTASVRAKKGDAEVEAKVVVENESSSLFQIFIPDLFQGLSSNFANIDASSLELEIRNVYNVTDIQDNRIKVTLTDNNSKLASKWFTVYKSDSSYRFSSPDIFESWVDGYSTLADGFIVNLNPVSRDLQLPSKFSISTKYNSYSFVETQAVSLEGCILPEFPVYDLAEYCDQ